MDRIWEQLALRGAAPVRGFHPVAPVILSKSPGWLLWLDKYLLQE